MPQYVIALLMLFVSISGFSQDIQSSIEWRCTSTFTSNPGTIVDETTKVVSSAQQITWYDNNGTALQTLTVTDVVGSWNNVSHNGSITFLITTGDKKGAVYFSRSGGATLVRIHLIGNDQSSTYELTVGTITTL